jgi:CubicO group peptidase (beta-lactamase class C family)
MPPVAFAASRRTLVLGLAAAAIARPAAARSAPPWAAVNTLVSRYVDAGKLTGACVTVRQGDRVATIARGAGAAGGRAADDRTIWRIFSMSKPVTGVAALTLVDAGKLGLDQPVADFAPAFAHVQVLDGETMRPARTVMRVRHLLTHTAGLGYNIIPDAIGRRYEAAGLRPGDPTPHDDTPRSLDEFGDRLAQQPLGADPGARYAYSVGLDLLGLVVQRASGMPFERYLQQTLFDPLAMTDTGFAVAEDARPRLSMNYAVRDGVVVALEPEGRSPYFAAPAFPSGGGGLLSSARDYDRFCTMLQRDGDGVIARAVARRAHTNLLPAGVVAEDGLAFGAGMGVVSRASATPGTEPVGSYFWGGAAGTYMWNDPVNRLSVVFMAQFMPSRAYPVWDELRHAVYADLAA